MTLPQNVANAVGNIDACRLETFDDDWLTIRDHLMRQEAEIADLISKRDFLLRHYNLAESRLAAANALLLRYCVQVGELTKGLDPHDPIYIDIQRLGADYMTHLQGSGDEA
jgi:hypothetical protein